VETDELADLAVTTEKIADLALTTAKLADRAVTQAKIANAAVSTLQLGLGAVTANEIATNAVTASKIADRSLPPSKIMSGASPINSVLTVTSAGNSTFVPIPLTGKILQIQSDVTKTQATVMGATTFEEFSPTLSVSITTQERNSTILVFLSSNIVGGYRHNSHINYPQDVYYALFKNGSLWRAAAGTKGTNQISGLGQARSTNHTHVTNISTLCHETVGSAGTTNTYSFRAFNAAGSEYYVMMNSQLSNGGGTTYSGIASLSSLYAIEIGG